MQWAEVSVQTSHEATEAVANIFYELGAAGVVIEDPVLIEQYRNDPQWDFCDLPAQTEQDTVLIKAYLPFDQDYEEKFIILTDKIEKLVLYNLDKGKGIIKRSIVEDADWSNAWKEFFHPTKIGRITTVKPSWEEYRPQTDEIVIEIDPGMAFGTGTHHTTTLCVRLLEDIVTQDAHVLDIGTGSGILAIAAAKLGAKSVKAIDIDKVAVEIARENIILNKVENCVTAEEGDLLATVNDKADIIIANIIADIIIRVLPDAQDKLNKKGFFIASGIIQSRLDDVITAIKREKLIIDKIITSGEWAAVLAHKEQ